MIKKYWLYIIGIVLIILLLKDCKEPNVITEIEYIKVTDTITNTIIQKVPTKVYVERIKTIKGKDTIIFKDKPTDSTIQANQYKTKLKSNNAEADLEITTTGELLDVQGVITYTQENKTVTTIKNASGLFIYGQTNLNGFDSYGLGIDYQFKNKFIIGTSAVYNDTFNNVTLNVKIGIKL